MKLRNVTIWTTGLTLIASIIVPILLEFFFGGVVFWHILWLTNGLPLFFSFLIAKKLEHKIPVVILLVSIITYGIWYGFGILFAIIWHGMIDRSDDILGIISLLSVCFLSLFALIPAWIIALILDSYYEKKTATDPGTACRNTFLAATSPAPFGNENVIE